MEFLLTPFIPATDPQHQQRFENWLCEVNSSDGISLLTALAQMAMPTRHSDPSFITTITLLIYQVSRGQGQGSCQPNEGAVFLTLLHKLTNGQYYSTLLFQVSYVSVSTREMYSKVGRELLVSIATVHPYIISVLLERLRETIKTVGMVGLIIPLRPNSQRTHTYCMI